MSSYDIWVDFNEVDTGGTVTSLEKFATREMSTGSQVIAGDYEGNTCPAQVLNVEGGVVSLRLNVTWFKADREHIAKVPRDRLDDLRKWLESPNGGLRVGRVTFEAVEDGSIWVRTEPWGA